MNASSILLAVSLILCATSIINQDHANNNTISHNNGTAINESNLMQKLWSSIGHTVSTDLNYLKSLTTSKSCHDKIETEYLQNILYPVIHKDQPFSYNLTNLCPNPNPIPRARQRHSNINRDKPQTLRIIYLIIMYRNPSQVIRLISALNTSIDHFLIHIDAKSSTNVSEPILNHSAFHHNIHIMERHKLTWGGYSMIEVELAAMKYAINLPFKFDFFYPLSESDYPLVSINIIKSFMNKYRGKTMMKKPTKLPNNAQYTNIHTECDDKLFYVGTRPAMGKHSAVKIYSTTVWAAYSYRFTKYLVTDKTIVPAFLSWFKGTATCDEKFFVTVLMNSPLCSNYVDINWHEWRLELWPEKNTDPEQLPCRISDSNLQFCGRGPIDIEPNHLPILSASPAMFARKFNADQNSEKNREDITKTLDIIDEWRTNSRSLKGKLLKIHKLIRIEMNGECLTFDDQQDEMFMDTCYDNDEMQMFMLECTGKVEMSRDTQCMQSGSQFDGVAMSQCQIRGVIWNRKRYSEVHTAGDECLSIMEHTPKVKEAGMSLIMDKCRMDGHSQWWMFDGCEIKYANPMMKYLKKRNQNLCIGVCDFEYGENRPCVKTCKNYHEMMTAFGKRDWLTIRIL